MPDIALKTMAVTVNVIVDPALKGDAGLSAIMLAEGRRWAETQRIDTDKLRREEPDLFAQPGYQDRLQRDQRCASQCPIWIRLFRITRSARVATPPIATKKTSEKTDDPVFQGFCDRIDVADYWITRLRG